MGKSSRKKKAAQTEQSAPRKREEGDESSFDPVEWLIRTHPATASWLGHDLTKQRGRR